MYTRLIQMIVALKSDLIMNLVIAINFIYKKI